MTPQNPTSRNPAPLELWRGLAQIAREEELAELEFEQDGVRVALRAVAPCTPVLQTGVAPLPPVQISAQPSAAPASASTSAPPPAGDESLINIVSPMVGVFYRAPSPSDPNFVEVGDKVEIGQTVALVEAMKVFNEITAEVAGTVAEITAASADLVETGQTLITIRP